MLVRTWHTDASRWYQCIGGKRCAGTQECALADKMSRGRLFIWWHLPVCDHCNNTNVTTYLLKIAFILWDSLAWCRCRELDRQLPVSAETMSSAYRKGWAHRDNLDVWLLPARNWSLSRKRVFQNVPHSCKVCLKTLHIQCDSKKTISWSPYSSVYIYWSISNICGSWHRVYGHNMPYKGEYCISLSTSVDNTMKWTGDRCFWLTLYAYKTDDKLSLRSNIYAVDSMWYQLPSNSLPMSSSGTVHSQLDSSISNVSTAASSVPSDRHSRVR